jgi:hypothetical protein
VEDELTARNDGAKRTPDAKLGSFIDKFDPIEGQTRHSVGFCEAAAKPQANQATTGAAEQGWRLAGVVGGPPDNRLQGTVRCAARRLTAAVRRRQESREVALFEVNDSI